MMTNLSQTLNHGQVYRYKHICNVSIISMVPSKVVMLRVSDRGPDKGQTPQGHEMSLEAMQSYNKSIGT